MKRSALVIALVSGCATIRPAETSLAHPVPGFPPDPAKLAFVLGSVLCADDPETEMARQAVLLANTVVLSPCFERELLKSKLSTVPEGTTTQTVLADMRSGKSPLDVAFFTGTWWQDFVTKTIGYDEPTAPNVVHMNRNFVRTVEAAADNFLHEAAHARGYKHVSAKDATSVPYTMNRIFGACIKELGASYVPSGTLEASE
jgi:hypothetical protein